MLNASYYSLHTSSSASVQLNFTAGIQIIFLTITSTASTINLAIWSSNKLICNKSKNYVTFLFDRSILLPEQTTKLHDHKLYI